MVYKKIQIGTVTYHTISEKMEILKDTLWLFQTEKIKILEIYKNKKRIFYHYSYQIEDPKSGWGDRIIWHNFEQRPHFDIFDSGGNLILQTEQEPKNISEIVKLVKVFRKNLMSMDLSKL